MTYGGGSAPDFNGIPYQAQCGHFAKVTMVKARSLVNRRLQKRILVCNMAVFKGKASYTGIEKRLYQTCKTSLNRSCKGVFPVS